jgi:hypothetical protein
VKKRGLFTPEYLFRRLLLSEQEASLCLAARQELSSVDLRCCFEVP